MAEKPTSKALSQPVPKKILLIQDKPREQKRIRKLLEQPGTNEFRLDFAHRLSEGLHRLSTSEYAAVLLDLGLPDSQGVATFTKVQSKAPDTPVIIHARTSDERAALRILRHGAQDILPDGVLNSDLLIRSIRFAIERQRLLSETRNLSLLDDLTGLYNRRGFVTVAQEQLKISKRTRVGMHFLFIDVDDLKDINDRLGHREGDNALKDVASILVKTFRESDIIARIGGDEFGVLARETHEKSARALKARLKVAIGKHNREQARPYRLSVSMGLKRYNPGDASTPEDLVADADGLMYKDKRRKNNKEDEANR